MFSSAYAMVRQMKINVPAFPPAATRDGKTRGQRGHTCLTPFLKSMRNRYSGILIIFASVVGYFLLASFALSEPLPNRIAENPLVFLLSGDPSAPVDAELQNSLNHLSFF
jgi:hypothetical protein